VLGPGPDVAGERRDVSGGGHLDVAVVGNQGVTVQRLLDVHGDVDRVGVVADIRLGLLRVRPVTDPLEAKTLPREFPDPGPQSRLPPEKISRKNRNTFSRSRKIDAASSGATASSVLVRSRWKSNMVNPAKMTRPSTE